MSSCAFPPSHHPRRKVVIRIFDPGTEFDLDGLGIEGRHAGHAQGTSVLSHRLISPDGPDRIWKDHRPVRRAASLDWIARGPASASRRSRTPWSSIPLIAQSQCNPAREYTYPTARSLMRQDPR